MYLYASLPFKEYVAQLYALHKEYVCIFMQVCHYKEYVAQRYASQHSATTMVTSH